MRGKCKAEWFRHLMVYVHFCDILFPKDLMNSGRVYNCYPNGLWQDQNHSPLKLRSQQTIA
jgi:hypothetical protein